MARGKKARRVSTRLRSSTGASAGHTQPQSLSPEERHGLLFSLPIELLSEIVFHVSTDGANRRRLHTLANLASTCRRLYDIVAPVLYKSVFLGRDERRKKRNLSDLLSFCEAILGDFGVHLYVQVLDITELKSVFASLLPPSLLFFSLPLKLIFLPSFWFVKIWGARILLRSFPFFICQYPQERPQRLPKSNKTRSHILGPSTRDIRSVIHPLRQCPHQHSSWLSPP